MTRAQFARDLQDGLAAHFGMAYDQWEPEYTKIFETKTSSRAFEDMILRVGLGEAEEKPEGGVVTFDAGAEGWISRVTFQTYAIAFSFTEEAIDDNLYADLSELYGKEMAKSHQHAKEVRCANVLNNAFSSSYPGGDGKALVATDHPLYSGGSMSNSLATSADMSEEALEDAIVQMQGWTNDRGRPINVKPKQVIIARQNIFQTTRVLKTTGRVGTDLNDINAIKDGNYIPGGFVVNHYLQDPDAWYIQTEQELGLMFWQRKKISKKMEQDFRTGNLNWKSTERWGTSFADWRCMIASQGSPI
jgi:phage major head subunit gpT-like protein